MIRLSRWWPIWGLPVLLFGLLGGCRSAPSPPPVSPSANPVARLTATFTPWPPSPTPLPLAAEVNGEPILLSEVQAEAARVRAAAAQLGINLAPEEAQQKALDDLIAQTLLAQAARAQGFDAQAAVEHYLAQLQSGYTSEEWRAYLASLGFDEEGYRAWLARALAAAWMRDQIAAQVPQRAEQVHVQQILLYNEQEAHKVWQALQNGSDFARLAQAYDPQTWGDLGWFPRGYLSEPALEEAAFALEEPGEISPIVSTRLGYHILRLLEREQDRPLSTQARQRLQQRAVAQWLTKQRQESTIRLYLPSLPTPTPTAKE